MAGYLLRRLATSLLVILGISIVVFLLLHVIAGEPGRTVLGPHASRPAVAEFNRSHGYSRSLPAQYLTYVNQLLHGNLGYSYKLNESVNTVLAQNAGRSAMLSLAALVVSLAIAIPLGIAQALKRNSIADNAATAVSFGLYAIPQFLLGFLLLAVLSRKFGWFPSEASQSQSTFVIFTDPRAMALPIATLAAVSIAAYARYQRSAALDQLGMDYIKVARAKGLPERLVLTRHLLRNSVLPLVTLVGLSVPALLAGNLIVESLFNYPGLGLLFLNSLQREDYPVVLAYTLIGGVLTVAGNLVADLALNAVDPRIRIS
jgi:peptide/nickel transport system permease protein